MASPERTFSFKIKEEDIEDIITGNAGQSISKANSDTVVSVTNGFEHSQLIESNERLYHETEEIRKRVNALRAMQVNCLKLEAEFYKEVHALECKYEELYKPIYKKRAEITSGDHDPIDEEWKFLEDNMHNGLPLLASTLFSQEIAASSGNPVDYKGVPGFWLITLKNVDMLADFIEPHDEPILVHLIDITVIISELHPMGYTLEFHFEPNKYFTNSILTKDYEMKCAVSESDPFSFDGPEIVKCKGCSIDWKKGQNVTIKTVKQRRKDKNQKGTVKTITKTVRNDSFFNFFDPPMLADGEELSLATVLNTCDTSLAQRSRENSFVHRGEESMQRNLNQESLSMDSDTAARLVLITDFEIGHFIRERLIPRAVLYYTGEGVEVSDEEHFDLEEDEENTSQRETEFGVEEDEEEKKDI